MEVTIIKNCITCGTLVFAIYNAQVADRGDTSHAEYKEDESMVKDTAKNEWKGAMGLQLKDGTTKDDTNVTKVDVHKLAQRDSPDVDPSKEKRIVA